MFKANLLLIEHNNELAKLIEHVLDSDPIGKQFRRAHSVDHALTLVSEMVPDVVIMDSVLPDMVVIDAIRSILALVPHSKLVVLTDHDDPRYQKATLEKGAHLCLKKTRIANNLLPWLRQMLDAPDHARHIADETEMRMTQPLQNSLIHTSHTFV